MLIEDRYVTRLRISKLICLIVQYVLRFAFWFEPSVWIKENNAPIFFVQGDEFLSFMEIFISISNYITKYIYLDRR